MHFYTIFLKMIEKERKMRKIMFKMAKIRP